MCVHIYTCFESLVRSENWDLSILRRSCPATCVHCLHCFSHNPLHKPKKWWVGFHPEKKTHHTLGEGHVLCIYAVIMRVHIHTCVHVYIYVYNCTYMYINISIYIYM